MKTLLFFDFDGTLRTLPKVEEKVIHKLLSLQEKGYEIILNTGRSRAFYLKDNADGFPFDGFLFGAGQIIWKGKEIYNRTMSKEEMKLVADYFDKKGDILAIEGVKKYKRLEKEEYLFYKENHTWETYFSQFENDITKFAIIGDTFSSDDQAYFPNMSFQICHGSWYHVEIYPDFMNKGKLMELFLKMIPFENKKVYAFGDSENDIEMLECADVAICMSHADNKVKEKADYIFDDIWSALETLFPEESVIW